MIVGDEEMNTNQVSVRNRAGVDLGQMTLQDLITKLKNEISARK